MGPAQRRLLWKLAALKVPVVAHPRRKGGKLEEVDAYVKTIDVRDVRAAIVDRARRRISSRGGFSILHTGAEPTDGFMCALPHAEQVIPKTELTKSHLSEFMEEHAEELSRDDTFFGGWFNPDDGNVYLDVSRRFDEVSDAEAQGREWDQLAIWDVKAGEEIRLANEESEQAPVKRVYMDKSDPDKAWEQLQQLFADEEPESD